MEKLIKNKNRGILFWITGLSGSGKTSIAKEIKDHVTLNYGPTINLSGDDLRRVFNLKKYSRDARLTYGLSYGKFCQQITNQKVNIILSTVSLFDKVRKWNKANISNYIEIYIKSDINKIIKLKKKYFYTSKSKNVLGKDIKPEFPKFPNIIIENTFKKSVSTLSKELIRKINKIT